MPVFLDTNILLYSISVAPDEATKAEVAQRLLDRTDCVLSVQVLQEFYVQATRKSRPQPLRHETAVELILTWQRFNVVESTLGMLHSAFGLAARTGFSLWDCSIIAAAEAAGCETLYTEDLSHGRSVGGVQILNPFRS